MADFVAVIKRAVDGLPEKSPAMRERVYEKARTAVRRQLENMDPRPSEQALASQLGKLETAIESVEAEYAEPVLTEDDLVFEDLEPAPEEMAGFAPEPEQDAEPEYSPPRPSGPDPELFRPLEARVPEEPAEVGVAGPVEPQPAEPEPVEPAPTAPEPWTPTEPETRHEETEASVEPVEPEWASPEPEEEPQHVEPSAEASAGEQGQEAAEPAKPAGPTPVPFGTYAIGRAPTFPMPPRQSEPVSPSVSPGGFTPSRYQTGFGRPAEPEPEPPLHEQPELPEASHDVEQSVEELPAPEPVAATEIERGDETRTPADTAAPFIAEEARKAPVPAPEPEQASPAEPVESRLMDEPAVSLDEEAYPQDSFTAESFATEPAAEPSAMEPQTRYYADEPSPFAFEEPGAPQPAGLSGQHETSAEALFEEELARGGDGLTHAAGTTSTSPADAVVAPENHDQTFGFNGHDDRMAPAARRGIRRMPAAAAAKPKGKGRRRAFIAFVALLILAGAGFAAWSNQDRLVALFSAEEATAPSEPAQDAPQEPEVAAVEPEPAEEEAGNAVDAAPEASDEIVKFTQRLLPNGREVDEGPAPGGEEPQPGDEGRTLAMQTDAGEEAPAPASESAGPEEGISQEDIAASDAADPENVRQAQNETAETAQAQETVGVGQTMFLYEERLGQRAPTALEGSVVWSMVEESPGGDAPPEEAIEGRIEVPEKDLSAIITFRRNADTSLPASHLIEIVFSLPANFEGGGIESVQRIAFKETEQDRGNELIAVPARITDDFFMIALNDYAEAVSTNLELMRERSWIDIPIVYGNGRRALITLDKGAAGTEIFNRAISIWQRRNGGSAG